MKAGVLVAYGLGLRASRQLQGSRGGAPPASSGAEDSSFFFAIGAEDSLIGRTGERIHHVSCCCPPYVLLRLELPSCAREEHQHRRRRPPPHRHCHTAADPLELANLLLLSSTLDRSADEEEVDVAGRARSKVQ
jgi:hypothetical protein